MPSYENVCNICGTECLITLMNAKLVQAIIHENLQRGRGDEGRVRARPHEVHPRHRGARIHEQRLQGEQLILELSTNHC